MIIDVKPEDVYLNPVRCLDCLPGKIKVGVSIERAGEILMQADLENGTNFFDQKDPNAGRNAIIEVLSTARTRGDLINYIRTREAKRGDAAGRI